ncbi:uncharacterized protein C8Q71DRAFT_838093 [Rhodofomes roseus]|uniref:WD40 repeat-like protein n=1 Tax=Rhodofomes roseus TaxID=34475 RepID=A0ABQ8KAX3_9APHY|nr:uncharacterized protein C8Q71DRAFT_838093 [Rhodofomes roseus]KAH9834603.1 hypothetical protein C8Q71DRAFT_838093 [Rhodofomes roseus]
MVPTASASGTTWIPPIYDCSRAPELEWNTSVPHDEMMPYNFARSAKWCPDGSAVLSQCEDRTFYLPDLPAKSSFADDSSTQGCATHARVFRQQGPILDYVWYPSASTGNPAAFCFLASVRECPVKLLDASDGRLRASYRIVDHRERQVAPHSLAFNATADRFYCGFEDAIEVFDVQRPGDGTRLHMSASKKSKDGLKGIISALAFSADASSGVFAAGSLSSPAPSSSNIALFSEATGEAPVMFVGAESLSHGATSGIRASVTQLMFNPAQPYLLYASFRRHESIYAWDLRGDVSTPVCIFDKEALESSATTEQTRRPALTNQKIKFDIDISGKVLGVGDQHGNITLFDAAPGGREATSFPSESEAQVARQLPILRYAAHDDAIGSVGFHPLRPVLLSVSGSRHFDGSPPTSSSSSESDDEADGDAEGGYVSAGRARAVRISRRGPQPATHDASTKLWNFDSRVEAERSTTATAF